MKVIPFPKKKYHIIYVDPPWKFTYRHKEEDLTGHNEGIYQLMSLDEIKNLPISDISEDNSILFLWVTDPLLREGLEVMKHWGFEYKTVAFTWVKKNRNNGKDWLGMGYWTRSNPEMCLLGTQGIIHRINSNVPQLIKYPRREHSRKPDKIRDEIVRLVGDVSRIELFARQQCKGWDNWGNELSNVQGKFLIDFFAGKGVDISGNGTGGSATTAGEEVRLIPDTTSRQKNKEKEGK